MLGEIKHRKMLDTVAQNRPNREEIEGGQLWRLKHNDKFSTEKIL